MRMAKAERQAKLQALIDNEPLLTDLELAQRLGVSVQTVRLDRLELGVPEMRARAKALAERAGAHLKSLHATEIIGELIELELGQRAVSMLTATKEMGFSRSKVVRGHYLFAQANSLAVAVLDTELALTGAARLRFQRPVYVGQRIIATATVRGSKQGKFLIQVSSRVDGAEVCRGQFVVAVQGGSRVS